MKGNGVHAFFGHVLLRQYGGEFAGAVVAEVVEYHGIAFFYLGEGLPGCVGDDYGLYEFVGDICVVRGLDTVYGRGEFLAYTIDYQVICFLYAVPSLVAVHGVETAAYGSDFACGFGHFGLKLFEEAFAAAGVGVAAVHEGVDIDFVEAFVGCNLQEFIYMGQ